MKESFTDFSGISFWYLRSF